MSGKDTDAARILLVEDEQTVRELARLFLEREGWEVVEAGNLIEAVECVRAAKGSFDLFILDICLPDGFGTQLVEQMRFSGGNPNVIYMTGDPGWLERLRVEQAQLLPKPFTPLQLIHAVRQTLAWQRPVAVVIEPQPVHRRMILSVLERHGMAVLSTAYFDEGIRLAQERAAAVLLTIPPSGESALERLRQLRQERPELKVIALDKETGPGAEWCDGSHASPLCEACLIDELARVLDRPAPHPGWRSEGAGMHQHGDREN